MQYTLEICAGSLQSALAALQGGAHRIELCDNLSEGGTTPSYGMIKTCRSFIDTPIFPIIRPRGGNFVYTDEEFEVMKQDIQCCSELGCPGVVFGILTADGRVDQERCQELLDYCGSMQTTFHRAFDRCADQEESLEDIIRLGFDRILTSGGAVRAEDGLPVLSKLLAQAAKRIVIMPGAGITTRNLHRIARVSGATEFHSTARAVSSSLNSGGFEGLDSSLLAETNADIVAEMRHVLDSLMQE